MSRSFKQLIEELPNADSDGDNVVYERMMLQIRQSQDSDLCERILRLVTVVYRPVTLAELASLLDVEDKFSREDLEEIVALCGSFLVVRDDVVQPIHQSARDFLFKDQMFASGFGSQHYAVFSRSLDILTATLRRDMYNLRRPGALIQEYTSNQDQDVLKQAQYSCVYWVDHLEAVHDLEREKCKLSLQDDGIIHRFLKEKLLNWLEALSLMKKMPDAARTIGILKQLVYVTGDEGVLRNIVEDVYRFLFSHKVGIELAPLQVYISAIIFSPSSSMIRQIYEGTEGPRWLTTKPEMPADWTAHIQSFEAHNGSIEAAAFSPDGTQLASVSKDKTAMVWDMETGACLHTFKYEPEFFQLVFSPHGKYLAAHSATSPSVPVEVWDLATSKSLYAFEVDGRVRSLAFSLDSTELAASCYGATTMRVQSWDLGTGMKLKTHDFSTEEFQSISTAFSPDGTHFARVVEKLGKKIQIWNLTTDRHLSTLDLNSSSPWIGSSAFSADAAQLAVATDKEIRIFDILTGACLLKLEDQLRGFEALQFLAAPTRLLSWNRGKPGIRIWDPATGACLQHLNLEGIPLCTSVISPDGTLIAAGIDEIEIWDMALNSSQQTLQKPKIDVQAIAFSLNGTQLAAASPSPSMASSGSVIEIRDAATGTCLKQIEYATEHVKSMVFSPDGKRLASGGSIAIEIWNVSSGERLQTLDLRDKAKIVTSMAISSDGNLLAASMTPVTTIWIWDLITGERLREINVEDYALTQGGGSEPVAVAFSPDDARLVLTLESGAVLLYDTRMGTHLQTFDDFFEPLNCEPEFFNLQFRTEAFIFTDEGSINIPSIKHALKRYELSPFTISKDRTWILRGQQRVLWLPPEYRPYVMEVYDGFVACIATGSPTLLFFQFAVGELDKMLA